MVIRIVRSSLLVILVVAGGVIITTAQEPIETGDVPILIPEVIATYPHSPEAYTQGLLLYEGEFYESTGRYGSSSVRRVDPETGEVLQITRLRDDIFGEGLARIDDLLYQITWREQVAIVFDRETLEPVEIFEYEGEGWGLCYDGDVLWMSNGSDTIVSRDPETFAIIDEIPITLADEPIDNLNELECVGDTIYSNVWMTDLIVQIDKTTGDVITVIDAYNLWTPEEHEAILAADSGAVLNGIAYDAENEVFFITGKLWDTMFEVRFVEPDTE